MNRTQHRLVTLCKLWGMVKLFHPALAWRAIDWDGALVAAIPAVEAATSPRAFAEAVSSMLAVLNDPTTCVTAAGPPAAPDAGVASVQRLPPARLLDDGILLTTLASGSADDMQGDLDAIAARLPEATAVVFDLR